MVGIATGNKFDILENVEKNDATVDDNHKQLDQATNDGGDKSLKRNEGNSTLTLSSNQIDTIKEKSLDHIEISSKDKEGMNRTMESNHKFVGSNNSKEDSQEFRNNNKEIITT
ncbi:hypothetical protein FXO38_31309 [Capsicum annuum]|nr:hypothetical protein FXO38_31309 [Capsicum annuum]